MRLQLDFLNDRGTSELGHPVLKEDRKKKTNKQTEKFLSLQALHLAGKRSQHSGC